MPYHHLTSHHYITTHPTPQTTASHILTTLYHHPQHHNTPSHHITSQHTITTHHITPYHHKKQRHDISSVIITSLYHPPTPTNHSLTTRKFLSKRVSEKRLVFWIFNVDAQITCLSVKNPLPSLNNCQSYKTFSSS